MMVIINVDLATITGLESFLLFLLLNSSEDVYDKSIPDWDKQTHKYRKTKLFQITICYNPSYPTFRTDIHNANCFLQSKTAIAAI